VLLWTFAHHGIFPLLEQGASQAPQLHINPMSR
jgi:hypothetical protein